MFEHHSQAILPFSLFVLRLLRSLIVGIMGILISLAIGMFGYHLLEKFSWPDAFVNAAMILSGMGPVNPLTTTAGKIFAGLYALYSGLIFIIILGIILAPVIHRFFHMMHHNNRSSR
ncbi:MAG: hypothetical protein WC748_03010 [Legionellales bacterium]|jgi:hypothetical protein